MATYGPGKGRSSKQSSARSSGSRSSGSSGTSSRAGNARADHTDHTDRYDRTSGTKRSSASTDLRDAIDGREHEFAGVGLIVAGIVVGLAVYFDVAGPLGRGIETLIGWFTGLGRYVVPIALVGVGGALVHKGRSDNRPRLEIASHAACYVASYAECGRRVQIFNRSPSL